MKTHFAIVAFLLLALITACSQAPISTPTTVPTLIPIPTSTLTPVPTNTLEPTTTSTVPPTFTQTPTIEPPSLTSQFLSGAKVLSYDPFDNMDNWDWDSQTGSNVNGVFEMQGTSVWASSFSFKQQLAEGNGIILKFKLQKASAQSEFVFDTGDWQTDSFRQFGIYNGRQPQADLFQGKNDIGGNYLIGNLYLKPATWYNILMAIGKNGEFLAVIWDPTNESHRDIYHETIGEKWAGQNWSFMPKENKGETITVDDFYQISFAGIN
jgi:hypothetical protein